MTYIEFFDKTSAENICACLTYAPERVIYIGDNLKVMNRYKEHYARVFEERGERIEFLCKCVSKSNLEQAVKLLQSIVDTYNDCVFDITGGEEILLLALGIVYEKNPDKNIQIHRINLRNNAIYDCDKDGETIYCNTPTLSVEENVRIYGGDIVYGSVHEDKATYLWDLNGEFRKDVEQIWEICKNNCRLWNTQIGVFEMAEKVGSADGLTTTASIGKMKIELAKQKASYKIIKGMVSCLRQKGLLTFFEETEKTLTVTYKNEQVKRCLTKAGQALEMKIFLAAKDLAATDGALVYDDVVNGVVIDWDGKLHDEETEDIFDTENEIDILMMHDMVPVFASCKNGVVKPEELYKLNSVAERFGGKYAKKVLIATSVPHNDGGKYFRQRAVDMSIRLVEIDRNTTDEELADKLENLWCN